MKIIRSLLIVATALGASTSLHAQQQQLKTDAKPPAVSGPVIQAPAENKTPAPAQVTEKDLPQTATKQSSVVNEPKPVKEKDPEQPAPVKIPVLPPTNTLVPPNSIKNR